MRLTFLVHKQPLSSEGGATAGSSYQRLVGSLRPKSGGLALLVVVLPLVRKVEGHWLSHFYLASLFHPDAGISAISSMELWFQWGCLFCLQLGVGRGSLGRSTLVWSPCLWQARIWHVVVRSLHGVKVCCRSVEHVFVLLHWQQAVFLLKAWLVWLICMTGCPGRPWPLSHRMPLVFQTVTFTTNFWRKIGVVLPRDSDSHIPPGSFEVLYQ